MKKQLLRALCLPLICSIAFANDGNFTNSYDKALKYYQAKDFKNAFELLNSLWEQAPENEELNFHQGRSALELKKYDEAAAAFDRVLISNQNP